MKPPPFDYVAPESLDSALDALAEGGEDAKVIAGGQSLVPLLSMRLAYPTLLVDLNKVRELDFIDRSDGTVTVGATTRHRAVERSPEIAESLPLAAEAMPLVGHAAIRSRGTFGGSIAHADPAAELPAIALALDATITLASRDRGERQVDARDFFEGFFTTTAEPDEILTKVSFPARTPATGYALEEVARRHGDFAMVGVATALTVSDGKVSDARIAFLNMSEKPVRATAAEQALVGNEPTADSVAAAAASSTDGLDPTGDLHASAAYRRKVAQVCVKRALTRSASRAMEQA